MLVISCYYSAPQTAKISVPLADRPRAPLRCLMLYLVLMHVKHAAVIGVQSLYVVSFTVVVISRWGQRRRQLNNIKLRIVNFMTMIMEMNGVWGVADGLSVDRRSVCVRPRLNWIYASGLANGCITEIACIEAIQQDACISTARYKRNSKWELHVFQQSNTSLLSTLDGWLGAIRTQSNAYLTHSPIWESICYNRVIPYIYIYIKMNIEQPFWMLHAPS